MAVRVLIACDHIDHDGALHGGGRQLIELLRALESRPVEATTCVLRAPSALGRQLQREGLPLRSSAPIAAPARALPSGTGPRSMAARRAPQSWPPREPHCRRIAR